MFVILFLLPLFNYESFHIAEVPYTNPQKNYYFLGSYIFFGGMHYILF